MPGLSYNPQEFEVVGSEPGAPVAYDPQEFDLVSVDAGSGKSWTERIGEKLAALGNRSTAAPGMVMSPAQAHEVSRVAPRMPGETAQMLGATTTDWLASAGSALNDIEAKVADTQARQFMQAGLGEQAADKFTQSLVQRGRSAEKAGIARAAREGQQEALPADAGLIERAVVSGLSSAAVSLPATLVGGPVVGASTLAAGSGLSRRREVLDAGGSEAEALGSGVALGALEGLTEFGPGKALYGAAKGSLPLYKELIKFAATELPGENITSIAQIVDDYRLGLRDDVTTKDFLDAVRDTTAATIAGGGAQLSVGGLMRAARERANRRAEERAVEMRRRRRPEPSIDVAPPAMPPVEEEPPAPTATAAPESPAPPYTPPGVQAGDVRVPEGPDVIGRQSPEVPPVAPTRATPEIQEGPAPAPAATQPEPPASIPTITPETGPITGIDTAATTDVPQAPQEDTPPIPAVPPAVSAAAPAGLAGAPGRRIADEVRRADQRIRFAADKLVSFVQRVGANPRDNRSVEIIAPVSEEKRQDLLARTGVDVGSSAREQIRANTVRHVHGNHPELTSDDWRVLPWLTANYDSAVLLKQGTGDQGPRIALAAVDAKSGYAYVAEVLAGKKHGERLSVVSFFKDHPNTVRSYLKTNAARGGKSVGGQLDGPVLPDGPRSLTSETASSAPPTGSSVAPAGTSQQSDDVTETQPAAPQKEAPPDFEASLAPRENAPGAAYVSLYQARGAPAQPTPFTIAGQTRPIAPPKEPVRREHVMDLFQRLFGVKVYQGKPFKGPKALLGFHRPKTGEVRIRKHNDLEITAHEVFHWIDREFPTLRTLYHERRFADELKGISYDAKKVNEGFAEFGRLFLTQQIEAVAKAPTFFEAFVAETQRLGIYDKLARVQLRMHEWYLQGAEARALSKIGGKAPPLRQRLDALLAGWGDRALQSMVDRMHAIKVVEREVTGRVGNVYESVRLLAGARNIANQFINYGTLRWSANGDLEFSGEGLRQIFAPVGEYMDDAMAYFVGRRAAELMRYGKENLFSEDEIRALLAKGNNSPRAAEIKTAFYKYQEYTKRLMDFAQQSGIVSGETRAIWERMYQNYVPFYRIAESLGGETFAGDSGRRAVGSVFKRLTGGTTNLNDTLENITLNTALIVHASLKNMAKRQLFKLIESRRAGARFAVRVPTSTQVVKVQMMQVEETLRKLLDEAEARALAPDASAQDRMHYLQVGAAIAVLTGAANARGGAALDALQRQATFFTTGHPPNIDEVDSILINGERVWFQIGDALLWQSLQEINHPRPLTLVEQALGLPKRVLTRGVTVTPEFQIANLLRDSFQAYTLSRGGQWPVTDSVAAFYDIFTESQDFKDFLANGGGFGNSVSDETKRLVLALHRIDRHHLLDTPAKIADFWDQWGQSFELATRLAEYKRLRSQGATKRQAAFAGREISSDFAMRGTSEIVRFFTNSVPFLGARLQGLYRLERELFERNGRQGWGGDRALRFATRSLLGVTLPALLLYALNKDDDDYQALPEETRMLYWPIKVPGTSTFALIPKPFEVGALFSTIPEAMWRAMEEGQPKALMDAALFTLVNTFSFDPEPQIVKPLIDVFYRNKYWTGAPIVPRSLENVEPQEQYRPWTAQSMVAIGRAFGVSPLRLEALLVGYLGTVGQWALMAADSLVTTPGAGEDPASKLSTMPIARRFLREAPYRRTSYETRFYELADQVTQVVATAAKIRRENRTDDLGSYLGQDEKAQLLALDRGRAKVADAARDISAAMLAIRRDPLLSGEQKTARMDALQADLNELFERAVKGLDATQLTQYRDALEGRNKEQQP
jgi:hypothetical protein